MDFVSVLLVLFLFACLAVVSAWMEHPIGRYDAKNHATVVRSASARRLPDPLRRMDLTENGGGREAMESKGRSTPRGSPLSGTFRVVQEQQPRAQRSPARARGPSPADHDRA
jgi:hypothetical protein